MDAHPLIRSLSVLCLLLLWILASLVEGGQLVPTPWAVAVELANMTTETATWGHLLISLLRGICGLALSFAASLITGLACGKRPALMAFLSPIVSAIQACPTILWISLLMVWAGTGSAVPVIVVSAATFPVLFWNIAQGVQDLNPRWFAMATLYKIPLRLQIRKLILPGIRGPVLAGLSFALGVTWKVTATAEYIGSANGIGARIFWNYRLLNMPRLFAWGLMLIMLGIVLETACVRPMRQRAKQRAGS